MGNICVGDVAVVCVVVYGNDDVVGGGSGGSGGSGVQVDTTYKITVVWEVASLLGRRRRNQRREGGKGEEGKERNDIF